MIFEILIFFTFSHLCYYAIIGIGSLIYTQENNLNYTNLVSFSIGLIVLTIIGQLFYYFNLNNIYLNLILLISGLIIFLIFKFKDNKNLLKKQFIISLLLFSGLLISKLHEDWSYHFDFIEQVSVSKPIIGIGNVEDIHVLSASYFSYLQKIFYLPYFKFKTVFVPIFLIYLNIVMFLISVLLKNKNNLSIIFITILGIILIKMARFSEFGFDYISNFILLKILIIYFYNKTKDNYNLNDKSLYILFFCYAVSIKLTALFFFPILLFLIGKINFKFIQKINFVFFILALSLIAENFLRSGCLFYIFESTCLDKNLVSWVIDYERITSHSTHVELWTKGFYHQKVIDDPSIYLLFPNWFANWIEVHFFYKVFEFILYPLLILIFLFIYKKRRLNLSKNYLFFILCFSSFLVWFFVLPQLRFGTAVIIALFLSTYMFLINIKDNLKIKKNIFTYLIVILIVFFNIKNLNRINKEFNRSDLHKFTNFPYPPASRIKSTLRSENDVKYNFYVGKKIKEYKWFKIIY